MNSENVVLQKKYTKQCTMHNKILLLLMLLRFRSSVQVMAFLSSPGHRQKLHRSLELRLPLTTISTSTSAATPLHLYQPTPSEIAERRQAQVRSKQITHERNLLLKENFDYVAIRLICDSTLKAEMKLTKREKKGRIFMLPPTEPGDIPMKRLRNQVSE
tara:strand:+ start:549 stop:1025 length:477 start_codon:yes stop_codon:yes gene_type:complete